MKATGKKDRLTEKRVREIAYLVFHEEMRKLDKAWAAIVEKKPSITTK